MGRDEQRLVLGVADDTEARVPAVLDQVVLELRPERRVRDVVDVAPETVAVADHHAAARGAEMRVIIRPVEQVSHAVLAADDAEEAAHPSPPLVNP